MKYFPLIFLTIFFTGNSLLAQRVSSVRNFRIYPSAITQTEPIVCVHPNNPLVMFGSAVTFNGSTGFKSEGVYVTTDGGLRWFGSDTCKGSNLWNHGGDPAAIIDTGGRLILNHIGSIFQGLYSHYSTDLGLSWSSAYTITSQQPEDKGTAATDNCSGSPYYGRIYAVWVNYVIPYPVLLSYTTNSGVSWVSPNLINNPPPSRCSGGSVDVGRDGKVYVSWSGMTSNAPFIEDFAGFAVSSDGGNNWNVQQNIFDMNGINGTLAEKSNIRVNGLPQIKVDNSTGPTAGSIYIVTNEKNIPPAGTDPDIILHRSTDGGLSWSAGIRVNQDALNNGKIQYFPAMEIDANGGVNIIFYDDRNTSSDSAEIILARSLDGWNTWTETVLSDHRFQPKPIIEGSSNYQGDHISLVSGSGKLFAFWMDDYSGLYQVWEAAVDLSAVDVRDHPAGQTFQFELLDNYPNPFNQSTLIQFSLPQRLFVRLKIYNLLGQVMETLVSEEKNAGTYTVEWNPGDVSSGLYFYRIDLSDGNNAGLSKIKKMVVLK